MHTRKMPYKTIIAITVFFGILAGFVYMLSRPAKSVAVNSDPRIELVNPKAFLTLGREFDFPLRDEKGKEITKIKYVIDNVEKRDEIIVKGQKATALKGKTFLILTLKISNTYEKSIQINSRDYIRLSVNGENEMIAADIHNDPVVVQPISTKDSRIGFPVNDTDTKLVLTVGEIKGNKETISLDFKE